MEQDDALHEYRREALMSMLKASEREVDRLRAGLAEAITMIEDRDREIALLRRKAA